LVLYTDGVTEARDAAGKQFDESGIRATLTGAAGRSAQATADAIEEAVAHHLGDRHAGDRRGTGDDLAVLVLSC
jgi:serine phosphatase RsbU (regulator of sigma subunit)